MKTILDILRGAGGYRPTLYIKIENPPYVDLVIEALEEAGPLSCPSLLVAQYGASLCDPEMYFEFSKPLGGVLQLDPYFWRNDRIGTQQWSRRVCEGYYFADLQKNQEHMQLADRWDSDLRGQGFLNAFSDKSIRG